MSDEGQNFDVEKWRAWLRTLDDEQLDLVEGLLQPANNFQCYNHKKGDDAKEQSQANTEGVKPFEIA